MTVYDFDICVVGLGGMGINTVYELSRAGYDVLGVDMYSPPHSYGSSGYRGKQLKFTYNVSDDSEVISAVRSAYDYWFQLGDEIDSQAFYRTHSLSIGKEGSKFLSKIKQLCNSSSVAYDQFSGADWGARSKWDLIDDEVVLRQVNGGVLDVDVCIGSLLGLSRQQGATIETQSEVIDWEDSSEKEGVVVTTESGSYRVSNLVLAIGPWIIEEGISDQVVDNISVERTITGEFLPQEEAYSFTADQFQVWELADENEHTRWWGEPLFSNNGFCITANNGQSINSMEEFSYKVSESGQNQLEDFCGERFSGSFKLKDCFASPRVITSDGVPIVDAVPELDNTFIAISSDMGFGFSPVGARIIRAKVSKSQEQLSFDPSVFSVGRFE